MQIKIGLQRELNMERSYTTLRPLSRRWVEFVDSEDNMSYLAAEFKVREANLDCAMKTKCSFDEFARRDDYFAA